MREDLEAILKELATRFADTRAHLFEVNVQSLEGNTAVLAGRVLEEATLQALRLALAEKLPGLRVVDGGVQVLRQDNPKILSVGTNLTGLYAQPEFGELLSELMYGWALEIVEERDDWAFVRQLDGYLGWAYLPYLTDDLIPVPTHLVMEPVGLLRAEPRANAPLLGRVLGGTSVRVLERKDGWARVSASLNGWLPIEALRAFEELPESALEKRAQMMQDAVRLTGVPYLWGGCSANGIDCSGFAQLLHRWVGIATPRDADMQYRHGKPVEPPFLPGDLLFFGDTDTGRITHVTISLGGWQIIHSSRARNGVYIDDVQSVPHLKESYLRACTYMDDREG